MASFGDVEAMLNRVAAVASYAAEAAANGMAEAFRDGVRAEMPAGHPPHTRTPSPPGSPPAWISGDLKNTIVNTAAVPLGGDAWLSRSGPTVRYARIQELGGRMTAHNPSGYMWWQEGPGQWHASRSHRLPARPYMKPARERMVADGALARAAAVPFAAVINSVI